MRSFMDADEKSTLTAPTIGLENLAKLEARLRALDAESDATGVRRFAPGPGRQKRVKLDPAVSTCGVGKHASRADSRVGCESGVGR